MAKENKNKHWCPSCAQKFHILSIVDDYYYCLSCGKEGYIFDLGTLNKGIKDASEKII